MRIANFSEESHTIQGNTVTVVFESVTVHDRRSKNAVSASKIAEERGLPKHLLKMFEESSTHLDRHQRAN